MFNSSVKCCWFESDRLYRFFVALGLPSLFLPTLHHPKFKSISPMHIVNIIYKVLDIYCIQITISQVKHFCAYPIGFEWILGPLEATSCVWTNHRKFGDPLQNPDKSTANQPNSIQTNLTLNTTGFHRDNQGSWLPLYMLGCQTYWGSRLPSKTCIPIT